MKQIKIFNSSLLALVDDEDFERLDAFVWTLKKWRKKLKARTYIKGSERTRDISGRYKTGLLGKYTYLHHEVLGVPSKTRINHIDGNGLNCTKENLRTTTIQQSEFHSNKKGENTSSIFKGVWWHKQAKRWVAEITINGKKQYLGIFYSEKDAALKYNKRAVELFGDFAKLNKV